MPERVPRFCSAGLAAFAHELLDVFCDFHDLQQCDCFFQSADRIREGDGLLDVSDSYAAIG